MRRAGGMAVCISLAILACGTAAPGQEVKRASQDDRFIEIVRLVQKQYVKEVDAEQLLKGAIKGILKDRLSEKEIDDFSRAALGKFGTSGDHFSEILHLVRQKYALDMDEERLFAVAVNGMLNRLDLFSNYISGEELAEFNKGVQGKFGGVGIQLGLREGALVVISPLDGTPASAAGLLAGDSILEIDGMSAEGMAVDKAVRLLTGIPGTNVRIKVRRLSGETQEFALTRAKIEVHTVKGIGRDATNQWVYWADPEKGIAYIRVTGFTEKTVPELKAALDGLLKEGMKGLILDLRFNPGGILKSAVEVCDLFVDKGIIVQTKGRAVSSSEVSATQKNVTSFFPMVVLTNLYSAAASEILAGCLQDHRRAIILGERSFGKGSVQNLIPLEGGKAMLKLTTAKYYLPSGRSIQRDEGMTENDPWGIVPDIVVPVTKEGSANILRARQEAEAIRKDGADRPQVNAATNPDPQLARALEELRTKAVTTPSAAKTAPDSPTDLGPSPKFEPVPPAAAPPAATKPPPDSPTDLGPPPAPVP